jgi:hypothetical protein
MRAAHAASIGDARRSQLRTICSAALLLGAGIHLNVGLAHAGSNFGTLSMLAAAAQLALGVSIFLGRAAAFTNAAVLLELVLLQLYLLNVTVGLPPIIAHVHTGGEHVVLGYTFALPGIIDLEGVTAVVSEAIGAAAAAALLRAAMVRKPT